MTEFNIGVDLVDIDRFRRWSYYENKHLYDRVFTPRETRQCLSSSDPASHFAANFSAKEAVYKAMNKYAHIELNEIEVLRDGNGAPHVNLTQKREKKKKKSKSRKESPFEIKLSLSHSASYAIAFVVVCPTVQVQKA